MKQTYIKYEVGQWEVQIHENFCIVSNPKTHVFFYTMGDIDITHLVKKDQTKIAVETKE